MRSLRLRHALALLGILGASMLSAQRAFAHPLHSTITELTEDRGRGVVRATIRVFADDFGTSLSRYAKNPGAPMTPAWSAAALGYVSSVFTIAGKAGAPMPIRSCGVMRKADLLWICIEVIAPAGIASVQVRNAMLCDLFEDQVNVVQSTFAGSRHSLLFTRGDRLKPLS
ncbi:MAG: hypothetical protein M3Z05_21715 [Gemmatimonadota bacterium]|nr:hypothetical protein [Gemmatimonadota bacterium]